MKILKRNTVWLRNIIGRWLQLDNKNDFFCDFYAYIVLLYKVDGWIERTQKKKILFFSSTIQLVDNSCQNYWREIISFFFLVFFYIFCLWLIWKSCYFQLVYWNMILVFCRTPCIGIRKIGDMRRDRSNTGNEKNRCIIFLFVCFSLVLYFQL